MSGPENRFRVKLTELILKHLPDAYVQKNHGSEFSAGLPDLMVVHHGAHAHLELKASKRPARASSVHIDWSNLSGLQAATLAKLDAAGANAAVLWLLDSGSRGFKGSLLVRVDADLACAAARQEEPWSGSGALWSGFGEPWNDEMPPPIVQRGDVLIEEFPPKPGTHVRKWLDRIVFGTL